MKKEIANRIKALRINAKMTQEQMAEKCAIPYNSYVKIENAYHMPSYDILVRIADVLEVTTDMILRGNEFVIKSTASEVERAAALISLFNNSNTEGVLSFIESMKYILDND